MGMMIFIMPSGLTLVFGLMDVINFGHGVFISVGAYVSLLVLWPLAGWVSAPSVVLNVTVLLLCILLFMAATGLFGCALPETFRGSFAFGPDVVVERYRVIVVAVGLIVLAGILLVLNRTRIGLL